MTRNYCEAKTRAGTPCQRPAGWGTGHVGEGRCKLHGGNAGAPIKHGRYSKVARGRIAAKLELVTDESPTDLLPELQIQRALFADYIDGLQPGVAIEATDINLLMSWADTIGRMVDRIVKQQNETALTAAEIQFLKVRIVDLIARYIDDPSKQDAFISELFGAGRNRTRHPELIEGEAQ